MAPTCKNCGRAFRGCIQAAKYFQNSIDQLGIILLLFLLTARPRPGRTSHRRAGQSNRRHEGPGAGLHPRRTPCRGPVAPLDHGRTKPPENEHPRQPDRPLPHPIRSHQTHRRQLFHTQPVFGSVAEGGAVFDAVKNAWMR